MLNRTEKSVAGPAARRGARSARAARERRSGERVELARELHDGLGQTLTGLKLDLGWLSRRLAADAGELPREAMRTRLEEMAQAVDQAIGSVQQACLGLRAQKADDLELLPAMRQRLEQIGRAGSIRCHAMLPDQPLPLGSRRAWQLFRLFGEACTNVVRHAQASVLFVCLTLEGDEVVLDVVDNGVGISAGAVDDPSSIGLGGMAERSRQLGGLLTIRRRTGGGTMVNLRAPVSGGGRL